MATNYKPHWNPYECPPIWDQTQYPVRLITRAVDMVFSLLRSTPESKRGITLVCISDTHNLFPDTLPPGDILIHAGDLTNNGLPEEIQAQYDWLLSQPHKYKIVIAGNHDPYFKTVNNVLQTKYGPDYETRKNEGDGIFYLQPDSRYGHNGCIILDFSHRTTINKGQIKIFGDPHTPDILGPEHAFQYDRSENFWSDRIPDDADIVITHGPPACHLDLPALHPMGDMHLLEEVRRVKPLVHVFGHIHVGKSDWVGVIRGGREVVHWDAAEQIFATLVSREGRTLSMLLSLMLLLQFIAVYMWILLADRILRRTIPSTKMVNAAMVYRNTGKLGNEPQVIHI